MEFWVVLIYGLLASISTSLAVSLLFKLLKWDEHPILFWVRGLAVGISSIVVMMSVLHFWGYV